VDFESNIPKNKKDKKKFCWFDGVVV